LKAIRMNRNLRAAQSAVHLQNGALKAIQMNRNLRVLKDAAHLKKKRCIESPHRDSQMSILLRKGTLKLNILYFKS
jgi:hypothetical protein